MANNCLFDYKIVGKEENVDELIRMMKWQGEFEDSGLGRIYEIWDDEKVDRRDGTVAVLGYGDCAWSVLTAMRNYGGRAPSLESETERLGLKIEIYSSEPGCAFQEHVIIDNGKVIEEECVDYEEHWVWEFDTIEEYNKEYGTNFTEDMVDEGNIKIGGFGDEYGVWHI